MINFEDRIGPRIEPPVPYPDLTVPDWWRDAKFGLFVHWGISSVPAWAVGGSSPTPVEDAYTQHQYADWYANTVRIPGSPTQHHHEDVFGVGVAYEDLSDRWRPGEWDAEKFVGELAASGARYLIPTTKHHDGFCLWDTATTPFNAVRRGPRRDLIDEFATAVRGRGLRFGVYYSGALDWHVSDFPPIRSDRDLFTLRRNDPAFARYCHDQVVELIDRHRPDVVWNDIDWPDAGKDDGPSSLLATFRHMLEANPEAVVNDRWGIPAHGHLTREYSLVEDILPQPWEATRGIGTSFAYNQIEPPEASLSGAEAVRFLVDVVSKNGNLLLNVGPDAEGRIPQVQRRTLEGLGAWLGANGASIFGTRPWHRHGDAGLRYTTTEGTLFVHLLQPEAGCADVPADIDLTRATWLDGSVVRIEAGRLEVPDHLRAQPVAVLAVPRA